MAGGGELTAELATYLAADRRRSIAQGQTLPDRQLGTVLFADIGGFTGLAESMEAAHGSQRGAEELAKCVHGTFDALVDAVDRHHGSIVAFAGDALTCWFEHGRALSAVACGLDMQAAMATVGEILIPGAEAVAVSLKVAVAGDHARRFVVGDPDCQLFDVLAGAAVDRAGAGEKQCRPGDVVIDQLTREKLGDAISVADDGREFVRVTGVSAPVAADPWAAPTETLIAQEAMRAWMAPAVYDRIRGGQARFLAEFRPVAAVFVSFAQIDYEDPDAGAELDAFIRQAQDVVMGDGGSVFDISLGDKGSYLLAVFGAPVARGDDVRRAVTAANELRRRATGELRIGVHAGRVYASLYSGRSRSGYSILGDVVNIAARLMTHAEPGQILMSGAVGTALDRRFAIHPLEPISVKGRAAQVAVCELVGTAAPDLSLSEPRYALPMVGRERELEAIDAALAAAKGGHGGVLAFRAEAGMGKSRLVNAAIRRAADEGFTTFAGECQPHGAGIPYLPWQPIWNGIFALPADGSDDDRREALLGVLGAATPEAAPLAPLLGSVLDVPIEDNDATRGMPAPVRKQLLEQVLTGSLLARAGMGAVCVVLEDLHWVDSLSRDLLAALAEAIGEAPVLIVLAYRPPDSEQALVVPAARELALDELSPVEASTLAGLLLSQLTGDEPDPATVEVVTERANGNPFYVEELVREIVERGGSTFDLPTSLESLILGRIDRLADTQQLTARVASVIGRRFETSWLTGAYGNTLDSTRVPRDLIDLSAAGLIVADTPPPEEALLFRHAVVRDVAYETLGFRLRQNLHEQLAGYLETNLDTPQVQLLAYHYARSANSAKEALYRRLAAEEAIRYGAYVDALEHVQRASEIVERQPEGAEKLEQELELELLLGSILLVTDGQGSAKAKETYDRARALSRELPPGPAVGRAIFGLWTYYLFQGLMGPTAELADEAVALTERSPDPGVRIMAHLAVSQTHMWTGQWHKCVEHYDEVIALYDSDQHQAYITQYAQNPRFTASNSAFWGNWMLGNTEQASAVAEEAIAEARALEHDFTYTIAFLGRPLVAWFRRDRDLFLGSVGEYVESAQRAGNPFYIALSLALDACAKVLRGEVDAGLTQLREQYATMHALGSKLVDPLIVSLLGESCLAARRFADGAAVLAESMPGFERDGRVSFQPDHLRLRAELLLALDPGAEDEALALLSRASEAARSHGSRSLELRAALASARVLRARGRDDEARARVAAAYAGFTEGFGDRDLLEAATFLA